ncbi:Sec-independent protein translocase family protein [Helcobacillus massiliensis]|uniref:translocase n=1 Tax=Helcobacillus massiliensis TaxID=521392 RepID=UPI00255372E7|nr:translocase [Helcobacillus massiliensis]MDK7741785.1 translocase [Helcobacillus massiliensis]WOO92120.1 translocase [Helcobacillus massiliensis]
MQIFGLNGWEPVVLILVFLLVIGPQRLPEYTQKVVHGIKKLRRWADESKASLEDEMGIAVDDLKKYDPRQYDPRRIVREAWDSTGIEDDFRSVGDAAKRATTLSGSTAVDASGAAAGAGAATANRGAAEAPVIEGTPYDPEAT